MLAYHFAPSWVTTNGSARFCEFAVAAKGPGFVRASPFQFTRTRSDTFTLLSYALACTDSSSTRAPHARCKNGGSESCGSHRVIVGTTVQIAIRLHTTIEPLPAVDVCPRPGPCLVAIESKQPDCITLLQLVVNDTLRLFDPPLQLSLVVERCPQQPSPTAPPSLYMRDHSTQECDGV